MRRLENLILGRLFNAVTLDDIISNRDVTKELVIDGKPIPDHEVRQMQAEIKAMEGFRIWHVMSNTTKRNAEERIFEKSVDMDGIRFGKAMLYNLSLQESIMRAVREKKLRS